MARKRTATLLYSTEEVLTVLEFFAVGDLSTAVLLRAVKGGVNLPQTNISAIFKVHLSLFLIAQFFITQLTLPQTNPKKDFWDLFVKNFLFYFSIHLQMRLQEQLLNLQYEFQLHLFLRPANR